MLGSPSAGGVGQENSSSSSPADLHATLSSLDAGSGPGDGGGGRHLWQASRNLHSSPSSAEVATSSAALFSRR